MTRNVASLTVDADIVTAEATMSRRDVRRLPVVDAEVVSTVSSASTTSCASSAVRRRASPTSSRPGKEHTVTGAVAEKAAPRRA